MPFGATRSGSVPTDKKFTGQRLDGTGLYYYGARYYDPTIGRFISADTVVPDFADPQSLNRYSYVYNKPLKYTDPSGHFPPIVIAGVVIGVKELVAITIAAVALAVSYEKFIEDVLESRKHNPFYWEPDFSIPTPNEFNMWPRGPPNLGPVAKVVVAVTAAAVALKQIIGISEDNPPQLPLEPKPPTPSGPTVPTPVTIGPAPEPTITSGPPQELIDAQEKYGGELILQDDGTWSVIIR
ncbi:MAG: RHS repeat-associated core domain-containing protein [Chloroflexi bacterium]|nr:RHS repeat-associated core domain-containing protein [Chloroflexota bacterium]